MKRGNDTFFKTLWEQESDIVERQLSLHRMDSKGVEKRNMKIIDKSLLRQLHFEALAIERRRVAYDLRTTPEDDSQRMLNVLEPGTLVPIHQHKDTDETTFCIEGCLDVVFFREAEDGEFVEESRVTLSPKEGNYGVQIPRGTWHTVEIYAPCTIFEAKDGKYVPQK